MSERAISVLGLVVLLLIAWGLSVDRRTVQWRVVLWGVGLQLAFAVFILKTALGAMIFSGMNDVIVALLGFTVDGARFLFGNLVFNNIPVGSGVAGTSGPVQVVAGHVAQAGASFAFNVLPTIIFFSSLMTLLYYMGVMQAVVKGVAWVMMRTMHTSGAETLSTAGNIFVGQTEAPLLIKPFVEKMTMSELMAVMTGGFATVAGGVMAVAKLMYPEREEAVTASTLRVDVKSEDANVIDAAARGAGDGLRLALNVGAMLLAFIALIALLNALLGWATGIIGLTGWLQAHGVLQAGHSLTLEHLLGWVLAPVAWIMGVPWHDATTIGSLLGVKTVVNEFVAYLQLQNLLASGASLSPRSVIIATYALAGFANFSSIAIQIGGIGGIAPSRRSDLSRLGFRAMIAGTIAAFMTATIAGILV
ncbi:MAG: nucleoside transporter C-terminal domain-containing protein [Gemmatimonadota bacterium]